MPNLVREELQTSPPLHLLYRPQNFDEVVGQKAVVLSLQGIIKRRSAQTFLFCGPPGTGKTSLARIVAKEMGCTSKDILELPAAVYTGVESMRQILETLQYRPFGGSTQRALILDECQKLSTNAWDSLLKATEEPPAHVIWIFCTTNPGKVPEAIVTRSVKLTLKPVKDDELRALVEDVISSENIKISESIVDLVIKEAHGSPRQALVNLAACRDLTDRKDAATVLQSILDSEKAIELCRFIVNGGSWAKAMSIVNQLEDENPESVRRIICAYMAKALRDAKTDKQACFFLQIIDAFSQPYFNDNDDSGLLISIGKVLFGERA